MRIAVVLPVVFVTALVGCGRKGDPLPPIVEMPQTTTDLAVYQQEQQAILTWSYPQLTRAGHALSDLARVEVWRLEVPPGQEDVVSGPAAEETRRQLLLTRGTVMDLAAQAGMKVSEPNLTRYDVFNADECFLTGTGAEIMPVVKIDGRVIGSGKPGPLTRKLVNSYHALTNSSGEPI